MRKPTLMEGLKGLKDISGKAAPAEPAAPVTPVTVVTAVTAVTPVAAVAPSRRGKVVISAYFDEAVRQQLAILAVKESRSQAAMLAEALNLLFERYGEAPIARA